MGSVIGLHQSNPAALADVHDLIATLNDAGDLPPLVDPVFAREPGSVAVPGPGVGDPLVELVGTDRIALLNLYRHDPIGGANGWAGTDDRVWLRGEVADRVIAVGTSLPDGFGLAIYDAWRSPATVRALYEHFYGPGSTLTPGFLADPDDPAIVPPHTTGAAVDLTLTWRNTALALGTVFDDFSEAAHLRSLEPAATAASSATDDQISLGGRLRRLLHRQLAKQGFVAMTEEWWHVSWGDQDWAAVNDLPTTRYGAALPS